MSLGEDAKFSRGKVKRGHRRPMRPETTVTTTERIHRSFTGVNNAITLKKQNGVDSSNEDLEVPHIVPRFRNGRILKKQNGMNSSFEDLEVSKKLKEVDTYIPHIMFRFRNGSVKYDIIERRGGGHYPIAPLDWILAILQL